MLDVEARNLDQPHPGDAAGDIGFGIVDDHPARQHERAAGRPCSIPSRVRARSSATHSRSPSVRARAHPDARARRIRAGSRAAQLISVNCPSGRTTRLLSASRPTRIAQSTPSCQVDRTIGRAERQLQLRITVKQRRQRGRHHAARDPARHVDVQPADHVAVAAAEQAVEFVGLREQAPAAFEQQRAVGGQLHLACRAVQEARAGRFQLLDGRRHGRARHVDARP